MEYVTSEENPGDDASRCLTADALLQSRKWLNSPDFLWKPECYWHCQTNVTVAVSDDDPEVKKVGQVFAIEDGSYVTVDEVISRFPSWEKL